MTHQGVVCREFCCAHSPDLDGLVKRGRGIHDGVLQVDLNMHDIVVVIHKHVNLRPVLDPIEHTDGVIVRARDKLRLRRVHGDLAVLFSVLLDRLDLLCSVVVENSQKVNITADQNHLLASDELGN